jgi:homogentisate 1,2-dioxygenase
LLEIAPYSERDFKLPVLTKSKSNNRFEVIVKRENEWYQQIHENNLMSALGWDGYLYPFAININSFCPKVGRIHLPPPVHKIFENENLVVCNFVPRQLDFHMGAITAPYYHMNIDSDEVLYYLDGNFFITKRHIGRFFNLAPYGVNPWASTG